MSKKAVISLRNVWKVYEMGTVKVNALRGVSLDIYEGEFVAIIGPSGSGKSTMMNIVGALDIPTRGKVFLDRKDIGKMHESDLAQIRGRKIGFIFQQFNLIQTLSAKRNVMLPMVFQGVPEEDRNKRAFELLQLVSLHERMDHKPNELSGGQQQRVAIARALANYPEMILADEPTGNLDTKTGADIMRILHDLHVKKKRTIVLVTHDIDLVSHAEKVIYLKDGQIEKIKMNNKKGGKKHVH